MPESTDEADAPAESDTEPEGFSARRSLLGHAWSLSQLLTHKPALPKDCDSCMRGKTHDLRKLAGKPTRGPQKLGDLVTVGDA